MTRIKQHRIYISTIHLLNARRELVLGAIFALAVIGTPGQAQTYTVVHSFNGPPTDGNPKYSKEAIRAGKTGTVLLTFVVDEYGRVKDCQVLKSLTPDLDGRAIYAASHATFNTA
jgi:TonB family protein